MWTKYLLTLLAQLLLFLAFWLELARGTNMLFFYLELLGPVLLTIFCIRDLQFRRRKFSGLLATGCFAVSGAIIAAYYFWLLVF